MGGGGEWGGGGGLSSERRHELSPVGLQLVTFWSGGLCTPPGAGFITGSTGSSPEISPLRFNHRHSLRAALNAAAAFLKQLFTV